MEYRKAWRGAPAKALDGVNLTIGRGETVGFIGNNGAGKSTTLRILLGLQRPSAGTVRLNGRPADEPEARRGVAYVPENPYLYDYLTPLELLAVGLRMHRSPVAQAPSKLRQHCLHWLQRFGIAHVADKRIRTFSKGMTQRTALAHALACEPDFLILDEPLSGLDPIGRQEVAAILDEYRSSGRTLFFSSHVLNDVEQLADRFVFLHQGRIRAVYSTTEFLALEAPGFAVTLEGPVALPGFARISSRLWQRNVAESELPALLADVAAAKETHGLALYGVRNLNSLERAYARFVDDSGSLAGS
ncbi:MAG: ABC transporter ATP-binding protein [Dokdonella sp.]|nr:MAG: ABC transporter ATP-binding protein [Dokdonella sp.]